MPSRCAGLFAALMFAWNRAALACPICYTDVGRQVRAGIFNEKFAQNLLFTALPFVVFLGIAAAIHFDGTSSGERKEPSPCQIP